MEKSLLSKSEGGEGTESNKRVARAETECDLPCDLTIKILSRTPIASLIRFKCVCKLWNSLTKDHGLINSHLENASCINPPPVIFSPLFIDGKYITHDLILIDSSWNIKYELRRSIPGSIESTPPCNGLMCFFDRREIEILNPTTQEFTLLPNSNEFLRFYELYFGFHPLTKEYKVVRISSIGLGCALGDYVHGCEVYTLGSPDFWREIGNFTCSSMGSGINVNGCIYWTSILPFKRLPDKIVVLDLKSEKFRYIGLPNLEGYEIDVVERMVLVELEKNICLVNANSACGIMDIWMLNGGDDTWIPRCRVDIKKHELEEQFRSPRMYMCDGRRRVSVEKHEFGGRFRFAPIYIFDEKVLFRWGGLLYLHDLHNRRTVWVFRDVRVGHGSEIYAFVETLVAPLRIHDFEVGM